MADLFEVQKNIETQIIRDYNWYNIKNDLADMFMCGLAEEVGEVAGLRKRELRHNARDISKLEVIDDLYTEEIGDVLWYLTALCISLGLDLETIWANNKAKLEERYG